MNNRLVIIGAGGHGRVVADNALKNGYRNICFVDDYMVGQCMGIPIVGKCEEIPRLDDGNTEFVIGIGNNKVRKLIAEKYNVNWITLIHPASQIGTHVSIGKGTVVMAGAVINACTTIGSHCIVNTHAVVEHDNVICDYVHISPNVALGGTVKVGNCSWIGIGASVVNNISICDDVIIGAGSVVLRDVDKDGTFYGIVSNKSVR